MRDYRLLPHDMTFVFRCATHQLALHGQPKFVHATSNTYTLDISEMICPADSASAPCEDTWEIFVKEQ